MWTWIAGKTIYSTFPPIYGTKGIADSNNTPAGRYEGVSAINSKDELFLFGGLGKRMKI